MGSSCSSVTRKRRSLSMSFNSNQMARGNIRDLSMTSSSAVNVHVADQKHATSDVKSDTAKADPDEKQLELQIAKPEVMPSPTLNTVRPSRTSQVSVDAKVISMEDYPVPVQRLLMGNAVQSHDDRPRQIRLCIAACESDTQVERLTIMKHVIQPLSDMCFKHGFSLQLIDPHWLGKGQSAHSQTSLPDELLDETITIPTLLLIILNDKLGSGLPLALPGGIISSILSQVTDDGDRELVTDTYQPINATKPETDTHHPINATQTVTGISQPINGTKTGPDTSQPINATDHESQQINAAQKESSWFLTSKCCKLVSREVTRSVCTECRHKFQQVEQVFLKYMSQAQREEYLQSGLEREVNLGLNLKSLVPDNVFVIRRTFTNISGVSDLYMDLIDGKVDEQSKKKVARLGDMIEDIVPNSNIFHFKVKWTPDELDQSSVKGHAEYVECLCRTLIHTLDKHLNYMMNQYRPTILPFNIPDPLYQELVQHSTMCQRLSNTYPETLPVFEEVTKYLDSESQLPMVLVGQTGADTHALTAHVARLASGPSVSMIVRFCSLTPESKHTSVIFFRVCEQLGHLFSKTVDVLNEKAFHRLLRQASNNRPLVLVFGEIRTSLEEWIPDELPPHVKVILVTSGVVVQEELKKKWSTECFVQVPPLSETEKTQVLQALSKQANSETVKKPSKTCDTITSSQTLKLQSELSCLSEVALESTAVRHFCDAMEADFGKIFVSKLIMLLLLAENGLSTFHLAILMSLDEEVTSALQLTEQVRVIHTLLLMWHGVKKVLWPFLHVFTHSGIILHIFYKDSLRTLLTQRYMPNNGKHNLHQRISAFCESISDSEDYAKNSFYLEDFTLFKYLEYPHHFSLCNTSGYRDKFLFNVAWLKEKLTASTVVCVLSDFEKLPEADADIYLLRQILSDASYALNVSGIQIASQILGRLPSKPVYSSLARFNTFLISLRTNSGRYMESTTNCFTEVEASRFAGNGVDFLCGLYWIPGNPYYCISLAQDKGEIVVWDVKSRSVIRTIPEVDHPVDLRMVDSSRAVVLCNRELKLYNLDTGNLETNIRGVLNLRTPMFGVQNEHSLITVSRNRMYINVIDISSGDTEATFKAGEDRFLNSLLISKNGKMMVCGDETQKPSPLLVWELEESRLLHDLRMPQHEFQTGMMGIIDNGQYVVCACKELESTAPNFLVVYDLISGHMFKIWKWDHNTTCLAVDTATKTVVSGLETGDILVWDLVSGGVRYHIKGVNSVYNRLVLASDSEYCVTWFKGETYLAHARTICVWDLNEGVLVSSITLDSRPSCCEISPRGDVVVLGLPDQKEIVTLNVTTGSTTNQAQSADATVTDSITDQQ